MSAAKIASGLDPLDTFPRRHLGSGEADVAAMLQAVGAGSLEELTAQTVPAGIRLKKPLNLPAALGETAALEELWGLANKNKVNRSFIGMGYYDTITPPVILRNILENPGWYTQYTPYQAEISQGRLEALLNFQTMVSDLTGLPVANASMLDEATAAAEAMNMCHSSAAGSGSDRNVFFVSENCHPQTIAVVKTRAKWLGIEIVVGDEGDLFHDSLSLGVSPKSLCGILVQYPGTDGRIENYDALTEQAHNDGILVVAACDLLALTLIKPPGEWGGDGADIAVGSAQRFGVPMGFGGPHAAFMACKTEFTRKLPGRIVGISRDVHGNAAYRLAIQTREQHIRREKATSNICTAQVLLAIMAGMYAVYHGPEGLKEIATRIQRFTSILRDSLSKHGLKVTSTDVFDTVRVWMNDAKDADAVILHLLRQSRGNIRRFDDGSVGISIDETTTQHDLELIVGEIIDITESLKRRRQKDEDKSQIDTYSHYSYHFSFGGSTERPPISIPIFRTSSFLTHPVFNQYHSEHEMLRYINRLQAKDLSLTVSMIPLGSCTMKLNATSEMLPVTWPEIGRMHPFAPSEQTVGYAEMFRQLEAWLAEITGFDAVSLQPNAGSQGEYAGLLAIRAYHEANAKHETRNAKHETRDVCLIPTSAHGTNPASAVVAGLKVVPVACDAMGNVDLEDLRKKAAEHAANLACIMVTYPSTHGVFEESIREICAVVHEHGGQVYMDGANMNAQVGLTSPGEIGADVCHLNLHKTFCIPHGGGGPGMGPIGVARHLAEFLPGDPLGENDKVTRGQGDKGVGPVSAAAYGSASILTISWMYIRMMGEEGLRRASQIAILNANYMAKRLEGHYPILFRGKKGRCAHEFILDCRGFEASANVKVEDIAKRLMDYGFHAPTMSWPVPGTLMFEPTESESKAELDRLCEAMIRIRQEIKEIEEGRADRVDNALKHAPHTARAVTADVWPHKYSREMAAWPAPWTVAERGGSKFWPSVGRIDNPYGDRNLICTCPPMEELRT